MSTVCFLPFNLLANARIIQNLWTRYWMVRDGWRGFPCSSPSCWCPKVMSSVYLHELFRYIMKPTVKLELCHTFVTNLALLQLYWPGACSLWISIPFNRWDEDPGLDATGHLRWKELLLGGTLWKRNQVQFGRCVNMFSLVIVIRPCNIHLCYFLPLSKEYKISAP